MMEWWTLLELFLASLLFAVTPGPGTVAALSTTLQQGPRAGMVLAAGEVMGDLLYLSIAIFSLGMLAETLAPAMTVVRWVGAAYLIYLGIRQFRSGAIQLDSVRKPRSMLRQLLVGFLVSGTNPKVVLFYLSFLPLFIDLQRLTFVMSLQVMAVVGFSVFLGLLLVVALSDYLRRRVENPVVARRINRLTGGLMVGVGVAVARSGTT